LGEKVLRILLSSGGKDSFYALMKVGKVDLALMLSYEFPRPSPHLLNMGKSVEAHLKAGVPVLVKPLRKGHERAETVETLKRLGASEMVAGDVNVEEHLRYMEEIAGEVGASLVEPLWGEDPEELLHREFKDGLRVLVIGCRKDLERWLGMEVSRENAIELGESCKINGLDPLGERGEYHTVVIDSPLHRERVEYQKVAVEDHREYYILRVV
jgi:uncharacterized protein (TIGR00290 family)